MRDEYLVSALFVETDGAYFAFPGYVDPWDINRDARKYQGPFPVVAHPPCERWGRYWAGGPSVKVRRKLGDDNGCFEYALYHVRKWGGVLEHPASSHAWKHFGLNRPPRLGGWVRADNWGWTCQIEQGNYGHPARKATWLYAVSTDRPNLIWGPSFGKRRIDCGFNSKEAAKVARAKPDYKPIDLLSKRERVDTPSPFRELLLALAISVHRPGFLCE